MAIIIDGKTYRNLQEQVQKNKEDIAQRNTLVAPIVGKKKATFKLSVAGAYELTWIQDDGSTTAFEFENNKVYAFVYHNYDSGMGFNSLPFMYYGGFLTGIGDEEYFQDFTMIIGKQVANKSIKTNIFVSDAVVDEELLDIYELGAQKEI